MADIFISYAREDAATAERLAHALEESGWSVFWDRHIPPGRHFDQFILEQIRAANCMIVLWSRAALASEWVLEEANEGRQRGILVPARIDNVDPPFGFGRIQCADLIAWRSTKKGGDLSPLIEAISVPVGQAAKPAADARNVDKLARRLFFWLIPTVITLGPILELGPGPDLRENFAAFIVLVALFLVSGARCFQIGHRLHVAKKAGR